MEIICTACSTKLAIPDEKVPKEAAFKVTCPKCQGKIQVNPKREASPPPSEFAATDLPMEQTGASSPEEDDFVENRRLAMACIDDPNSQSLAKAALAQLGYTVHVVTKQDDALDRIRKNRYEVVLLHEEFGGSALDNLVLRTVQPMTMAMRRHMCVGLLGKQFRTFDHMAAFAHSVNFVVAEREASKLSGIVRQALSENDQFYRVFRECLREAGKP